MSRVVLKVNPINKAMQLRTKPAMNSGWNVSEVGVRLVMMIIKTLAIITRHSTTHPNLMPKVLGTADKLSISWPVWTAAVRWYKVLPIPS